MTDETKLENLVRRYWLLDAKANQPGIPDVDTDEWCGRADVLAGRIADLPAEDLAGVVAKLRIFTRRNFDHAAHREPKGIEDGLAITALRDAERLVEEGGL